MQPADSFDVFLRPDLLPSVQHFFSVFGERVNLPDGGTLLCLKCSRIDTEDPTYLALTIEPVEGQPATRLRIPHQLVLSISGPGEPPRPAAPAGN